MNDKSDIDFKGLAEKADRSGFAELVGLKTTLAEHGRAEAELYLDDRHLNLFGMTHGAVLYALADHVCSVAGNTLGRPAVMTQSSTNFFRNPKPGHKITAQGKVVVSGRNLGYIEVSVSDDQGRRLLAFTAGFFFIDKEQPPK